MFFILVQQPLKTSDKLSGLTLVYPDDIGVCRGEEILVYLHLRLISTWISFFFLNYYWQWYYPLIFHLTIVRYVLVLSSHAEMGFIDIKNSYGLFRIWSVDQNQLFIAVSSGKCIAESSWVPNKASEANVSVF